MGMRSISAVSGIYRAMQIAPSLEPYGILYLKDPMLPDNLEGYASLARETSIPVCISERLSSRFRFREMFERRAVGCLYI
jgi:L-alanine-DL-glutamate epimerase-like enolase superfamily enzyme